MDFIDHLKTYLNEKEINLLKESLDQKAQHALLLNEEKMDKGTLLNIYQSLKNHPIIPHAFIYDKDELDLGKSVYHELGCFYLQEPSAMLPSFLLNPKENELVLDLCAAPGGKSIQASFLMHNKGLIIANDLAKNRALAVLENVERLGRGNILITNNDFSSIYTHYLNTFDKIILDAPCSGSGMFRKDNKMLLDWSMQKVYKYSQIQKDLILYSYKMLKPGGTLVYSTCSFSYEEDEEVIKYLLTNSDAVIKDIPSSPYYYQSQEKIGIHLFPYLFPGEGHYICLINKPGNNNKPHYHDDNYQTINKYGDYQYLVSQSFNIKYLNVIRNGVKVGLVDKNEIRYDFHYARYKSDFKSLEINKDELYAYYRGEAINKNYPKGYVLLKYQGLNVDIAKSDGRIIKNRLPKGLRKVFKD